MVDPDVRLWLQRLPELEPPPGLWLRIRERQRSPRRKGLAAAGIAAGFAVLALGLALLVEPRAPAIPAHRESTLEALIGDNQRLAERLQDRRAEATALPAWQRQQVLRLEVELAALDRRLQTGHARAEAQALLEPLWRARADLLERLIEVHEQPRHIGRI
jgi:hypothetical protein